MSVCVREDFADWDKKMVRAGTYEGACIVRMGRSPGSANWFWNIIQDGNVVAVTLGHPPHTIATHDADHNAREKCREIGGYGGVNDV